MGYDAAKSNTFAFRGAFSTKEQRELPDAALSLEG